MLILEITNYPKLLQRKKETKKMSKASGTFETVSRSLGICVTRVLEEIE